MWDFTFFRYAVFISVFLSFLFALISFIIVTRRLSFLAIGTEHAAFGGIGIANFFGWNVFLTTSLFCMILTVLAGKTHKKSVDMGTNLLFSGAMALGMILLTLQKNQSFNLMGFLFGDLIGINQLDLLIGFLITFLIFLILLPALGKIMYISFDRDAAIVSGINVDFWDMIVYASLSLSIILGIKLVGVLLVVTMTILPAAFAMLWQKNVYTTLSIAFVYTLCSMIGGIVLSFYFNSAPGALIVAISVSIYLISKFFIKIKAGY